MTNIPICNTGYVRILMILHKLGMTTIELKQETFHVLITKTLLFKYVENFTTKKGKFSDKKKNRIFFIFLLKNIDCGYSLEPPRRGGSNEYPQSMFLSRI